MGCMGIQDESWGGAGLTVDGRGLYSVRAHCMHTYIKRRGGFDES